MKNKMQLTELLALIEKIEADAKKRKPGVPWTQEKLGLTLRDFCCVMSRFSKAGFACKPDIAESCREIWRTDTDPLRRFIVFLEDACGEDQDVESVLVAHKTLFSVYESEEKLSSLTTIMQKRLYYLIAYKALLDEYATTASALSVVAPYQDLVAPLLQPEPPSLKTNLLRTMELAVKDRGNASLMELLKAKTGPDGIPLHLAMWMFQCEASQTSLKRLLELACSLIDPRQFLAERGRAGIRSIIDVLSTFQPAEFCSQSVDRTFLARVLQSIKDRAVEAVTASKDPTLIAPIIDLVAQTAICVASVEAMLAAITLALQYNVQGALLPAVQRLALYARTAPLQPGSVHKLQAGPNLDGSPHPMLVASQGELIIRSGNSIAKVPKQDPSLKDYIKQSLLYLRGKLYAYNKVCSFL